MKNEKSDDYKIEEKFYALDATVKIIVERVLTDMRCPCPHEVIPEFDHYIYKDTRHPDIKNRPNPKQYVGMSAIRLMEMDIASEILKFARKMVEIEKQ
jgi:hypothetical protein